MRPIDADELKNKAQKISTEAWKMNLTAKVETTLNQFIDWIDEQQTIDALPVRHGKWIPCAKSGLILTEQMRKEGIRWYGFKCSACNFVRKGNAPRDAKYCECCGARMDEDDYLESDYDYVEVNDDKTD